MQVPEKLALIGGSILLSSTLVFTLKSQASSIIPKVGHSISGVFDHIGDTQKSSDFNSGYQQAQKNGDTTGTWGSSKYYVDKDDNLHIGQGELQGRLYNVLGSQTANTIKSINFDQSIKAPQDSSLLLSGTTGAYDTPNSSIASINGLNNLDTSNVTNMYGMFASDASVKSLDLSGWNTSKLESLELTFHHMPALTNLNVNNLDTSHVKNMGATFEEDSSLQNLNISHWNTQSVYRFSWMFANSSSLQNLNLSNFDTSNGAQFDNIFVGLHSLQDLNLSSWDTRKGNMTTMFSDENSLHTITLGNNTYPQNDVGLNGNWKQGNTVISAYELTTPHPAPDSHSNAIHPGTWVKQ